MSPRYIILLLLVTLLTLSAYFPYDTVPTSAPQTPAALGELLFNDVILSADRSISCASCHRAAFAFADTVAFSMGVRQKRGNRNTPSLTNMSARDAFFWDGRAPTLEAQALMPIANPNEMNLPIKKAIKRLRKSKTYQTYFRTVFGSAPDSSNLAAALAEYERTLETGNNAFDRFMFGEKNAISDAAKRGRVLFVRKAKCFDCHFSPDFTADEYKNIGLYNATTLLDKGRFAITGDSADLGRFKVPGLRNVAVTAPYMHNGMFSTLRQVIDYYDNPNQFVSNSINRDTTLNTPLHLTEQEKQDLEAFLRTLTDEHFTPRN